MAVGRNEVGVGCLLVAAAGVAAFLALQVGALSFLVQDRVHVHVSVADAAGLTVGAAVSVAGVGVGQVESLEVRDGLAWVGLGVDRGAQLGQQTQLRVRARSLLGEKYLEVVPGPAGAPLNDGDALPPVGEQVEIDELVQAFGPVLAALDPDDLARAVTALADALQEDPERISRMLAHADTALANAAVASEALPGLLTDGKAALSDARGTLGAARGTLAVVGQRADAAGPVITRADALLQEVAAAGPGALVSEARGAVTDARGVLHTIDDASGRLDAILDGLSEIDRAELERMMREEGVLIRFRPRKSKETP
jgi:phospholipid/cholesterol/gamma-HCH transport system substrate-binding protein